VYVPRISNVGMDHDLIVQSLPRMNMSFRTRNPAKQQGEDRNCVLYAFEHVLYLSTLQKHCQDGSLSGIG
jgi:hypothetical protein